MMMMMVVGGMVDENSNNNDDDDDEDIITQSHLEQTEQVFPSQVAILDQTLIDTGHIPNCTLGYALLHSFYIKMQLQNCRLG